MVHLGNKGDGNRRTKMVTVEKGIGWDRWVGLGHMRGEGCKRGCLSAAVTKMPGSGNRNGDIDIQSDAAPRDSEIERESRHVRGEAGHAAGPTASERPHPVEQGGLESP
jgi:hypothetical protein